MQKKVLILSIDGGGVRGIIPAKLLQLLENDIQKSIPDIFDIYAGTSTGAIIVCALSGLNKPPSQILADFHSEYFIKNIFKKNFGIFNFLYFLLGSKYSGASKAKTLREYFGNKSFKNISKPTLITSFNLTKSKAAIFKSTGGTMLDMEESISTIVDTSTSAPTYFPPINIINKHL